MPAILASMISLIIIVFFHPSAEKTSHCNNDRIVKLVASLSTQVCKQNPPFCNSLHEGQSSTGNTLDHSVLRDREMTLQVSLLGLTAPEIIASFPQKQCNCKGTFRLQT